MISGCLTATSPLHMNKIILHPETGPSTPLDVWHVTLGWGVAQGDVTEVRIKKVGAGNCQRGYAPLPPTKAGGRKLTFLGEVNKEGKEQYKYAKCSNQELPINMHLF